MIMCQKCAIFSGNIRGIPGIIGNLNPINSTDTGNYREMDVRISPPPPTNQKEIFKNKAGVIPNMDTSVIVKTGV